MILSLQKNKLLVAQQIWKFDGNLKEWPNVPFWVNVALHARESCEIIKNLHHADECSCRHIGYVLPKLGIHKNPLSKNGIHSKWWKLRFRFRWVSSPPSFDFTPWHFMTFGVPQLPFSIEAMWNKPHQARWLPGRKTVVFGWISGKLPLELIMTPWHQPPIHQLWRTRKTAKIETYSLKLWIQSRAKLNPPTPLTFKIQRGPKVHSFFLPALPSSSSIFQSSILTYRHFYMGEIDQTDDCRLACLRTCVDRYLSQGVATIRNGVVSCHGGVRTAQHITSKLVMMIWDNKTCHVLSWN